ncbi:MAG: cupin domain-containing protein [Pseudomonadota bacterium]
MRINVLYAGEDGLSRWRDEPIALVPRLFAPPAGPIAASDPDPAETLLFLELPPGWDDPAHPSPRRQTLLVLSGAVEVRSGDGEIRLIGPGDVWRMEDTRGEGHHTRVHGEDTFRAAVVQHA